MRRSAAERLAAHLEARGAACPVGEGDEELVVYAPNRTRERQARAIVGATWEDVPVRVVRSRSAPAKSV